MQPLIHFCVENRGRVHILRFLDARLLGHALLKGMQDELFNYVETLRPASLILSFADVLSLSSEAVNPLLQARKKIDLYGGELWLSDMRHEVSRVFGILKLDGTVFSILPSEAHALSMLS